MVRKIESNLFSGTTRVPCSRSLILKPLSLPEMVQVAQRSISIVFEMSVQGHATMVAYPADIGAVAGGAP